MDQLFSPQAAITFILVLARIAGVMTGSPFFSAKEMPRKVKVLLALMLALMILPSIPMVQTVPKSIYYLLKSVVSQASFGLLVGLGISLAFTALQSVGALMDIQIGLGMSSMIDPTTGFQSTIISRWHAMLALMLFIGLNGHHWLILGLINSFKLVSLEQSFLTPGIIDFLIKSFCNIHRVAFNFAAPVLISVLMVDVTSGIIARTAPKLNVLFVAIPFKIGLGFFVMFVSLSGLVVVFSNFLMNLKNPLLKMFYM